MRTSSGKLPFDVTGKVPLKNEKAGDKITREKEGKKWKYVWSAV